MHKHSVRPFEKGIKKYLGALEAEIMEAMWDWNCASSVKDVHAFINKSRKIAYTTVLTVMSRLHAKGLLNRLKNGRCYLYLTSYGREEFMNLFNKKTISGMIIDFKEPTLSHFVDALEGEDPEMLKRLQVLLEEKLKKKQGS